MKFFIKNNILSSQECIKDHENLLKTPLSDLNSCDNPTIRTLLYGPCFGFSPAACFWICAIFLPGETYFPVVGFGLPLLCPKPWDLDLPLPNWIDCEEMKRWDFEPIGPMVWAWDWIFDWKCSIPGFVCWKWALDRITKRLIQTKIKVAIIKKFRTVKKLRNCEKTWNEKINGPMSSRQGSPNSNSHFSLFDCSEP